MSSPSDEGVWSLVLSRQVLSRHVLPAVVAACEKAVMRGPSSGEAWRRITAIRGLAVAAMKPAREMLHDFRWGGLP